MPSDESGAHGVEQRVAGARRHNAGLHPAMSGAEMDHRHLRLGFLCVGLGAGEAAGHARVRLLGRSSRGNARFCAKWRRTAGAGARAAG